MLTKKLTEKLFIYKKMKLNEPKDSNQKTKSDLCISSFQQNDVRIMETIFDGIYMEKIYQVTKTRNKIVLKNYISKIVFEKMYKNYIDISIDNERFFRNFGKIIEDTKYPELSECIDIYSKLFKDKINSGVKKEFKMKIQIKHKLLKNIELLSNRIMDEIRYCFDINKIVDVYQREINRIKSELNDDPLYDKLINYISKEHNKIKLFYLKNSKRLLKKQLKKNSKKLTLFCFNNFTIERYTKSQYIKLPLEEKMELQKQLNYMTKSELNSEIEYKDVINEIKKLVLYKENKKIEKIKGIYSVI